MKKWVFSLCLVINASIIGLCQFDQDQTFQVQPDTDSIDVDSIDYERYTKKTSSFRVIFSGKPGRAALYSLLIPGGGQLYNRRYWKLPIIWAADGAAVYYLYFNYSEYIGFKHAYQDMYDGKISEYRNFTSQEALRNYRDYYRKNYETSMVIGVAVHLLTVIEAYVDRHLMVFDISEDLSLQFVPKSNNLMPIGLCAVFRLH